MCMTKSSEATKLCTAQYQADYLKVSKSRKQIILSSHSPKNQRKIFTFFALDSKSGRIKKVKVFYCIQLHQISIFVLLSFVWTIF